MKCRGMEKKKGKNKNSKPEENQRCAVICKVFNWFIEYFIFLLPVCVSLGHQATITSHETFSPPSVQT